MRRVACLSAALALTLSVIGSAQRTVPPGPPPGRLIDVAGVSLHIRCVGSSEGPTVILEAGAGDYSNRWSAVQDLLAPRIRSCAYDRAGLGWSGGAQHESIAQDNDDLHALLTAAFVSGPYVLVGHSLGALMVRRYFSRFPGGIVGMVLVGAAHENTQLFNLGTNQWMRMREQASPMGADFREVYEARQSTPVPLGNRPLAVVIGTRPDPIIPDHIKPEKAAEQEDLLRLSNNSKMVRDPSSGHQIHVDNPGLVANAIAEVVEASRW
jgi:pimeloyl-ACP methyl ester carboxylesterase